MNSETKLALIAFIDAVENLAHSVSSVSGTDARKEVLETGYALRKQLNSDETIL
jgi:hypothetical protein